MKRLTAGLMVATVAVACTKNSAPAHPASDASASPAAAVEAPNSVSPDETQVVIDPSIREACGISDADAYFEYDSARVSEVGRGVLGRLADCFSTGPLHGKSMQLVGHADPRGSEEYNMVLGSRRAESVKAALGKFGLAPDVVMTSSRGEMEAKGSDTKSWAHDRRVDVRLGGPSS